MDDNNNSVHGGTTPTDSKCPYSGATLKKGAGHGTGTVSYTHLTLPTSDLV